MNRSISKLGLSALAVVLLVVATGCGKNCKKAREDIIQPTEGVMSYLRTNPSGQALAAAGCDWILDQFEQIPEGADIVRKIAETRFTHTNSRCLYWVPAQRMHCTYPPAHGPRPPGYQPRPQCWYEHYNYCGRWDHSIVQEPGYAEAMELSRDLDVMYDRAQRACATANAGDFAGANYQARQLLRFIRNEVKPNGDRVYQLACG